MAPRQSLNRSRTRIVFSRSGLFASLLGFIVFAYWQQSRERIAGEPAWLLLAKPDARARSKVAAAARTLVDEQPLDQARLNLVYVTEAKNGISTERNAAYVEALKGLGWRDTPSQQNLIIEASKANDPEGILRHVDALLRREKMVDTILPLLIRVEMIPQATDLLIDHLARQPGWRLRYFRFGDPLQNEAVLDARARLIERMLERKLPISHEELYFSLAAMMRGDRRTDLAEIARRLTTPGGRDPIIFDPDFSRFVASPDARYFPLPFEWSLTNRPGISTQIAPSGNVGQLRIRWDGSGRPILARIMSFLLQGDSARLAVDVAGPEGGGA